MFHPPGGKSLIISGSKPRLQRKNDLFPYGENLDTPVFEKYRDRFTGIMALFGQKSKTSQNHMRGR